MTIETESSSEKRRSTVVRLISFALHAALFTVLYWAVYFSAVGLAAGLFLSNGHPETLGAGRAYYRALSAWVSAIDPRMAPVLGLLWALSLEATRAAFPRWRRGVFFPVLVLWSTALLFVLLNLALQISLPEFVRGRQGEVYPDLVRSLLGALHAQLQEGVGPGYMLCLVLPWAVGLAVVVYGFALFGPRLSRQPEDR